MTLYFVKAIININKVTSLTAVNDIGDGRKSLRDYNTVNNFQIIHPHVEN